MYFILHVRYRSLHLQVIELLRSSTDNEYLIRSKCFDPGIFISGIYYNQDYRYIILSDDVM